MLHERDFENNKQVSSERDRDLKWMAGVFPYYAPYFKKSALQK